jgi:predicted nicotinamide N-methyase
MSKSVLVLVEGDGIVEGCQRIRLPLQSSDLDSFRNALLDALRATSTTAPAPQIPKDVKIQIFDPKSQSFETLTTERLLTSSNCRLRLVDPNAETSPWPLSSDQQILALPWKEFNVNLMDGSFQINNKSLRIQEVVNAGLGTGLNVWDGSIALAKYLESRSDLVENKIILELGAGTGLVGIAAAMLGARQVVVTDLEYSLVNLQRNILLNQQPDENSNNHLLPIEANVLDWFHPEDFELWTDKIRNSIWTPDIILASDVVWVDSLVEPLVQTLTYICTMAVADRQNPPMILMSYQRRSRVVENHLFQALREHDFQIDPLPKEEVRSERIEIFQITFQQKDDHSR